MLVAMHAGTATLAWLIVGSLIYIYRMIKYLNVEEEPDVMVEEHPFITS
jgi:hypothetical protein